MKATMLTTIDNPYDPFTQYDDWYAYDEQQGYNTTQYLGRIAKTSIDLPESINQLEINKAIDEILEYNLLGIYKKVTKEV